MVGEEQVTTVGGVGLEGLDGCRRCQVAGQVLPAEVDADAVTHYPAHGIVLDIEVVDGRRGEQDTLALVHIVGLEPLDSALLVVAISIVVGHEHGHFLFGRRAHIGQAVGSESLQLILAGIGLSAQVPLIGCQAHCEDATVEGRGGSKVDDTGAAVIYHVVPGTQHGRVGQVFPSLYYVGAGCEMIGIEVPHAVVVALDARTDKGVDAAVIQAADELHATVDVVTAVVIDLALGVTDDGLRTPDVAILATLATAEDTGSIKLGNTSNGYGELGSVVGEEQVTTVGGKGLQSLDGSGRCQVAGQVLPAEVDTDAVAHYPASRLALDIEVVDGRGSEQDALAGLHVIVLEPFNSALLIGRGLIVLGNKHSNCVGSRLGLIVDVQAHGLSLGYAAVVVTGLDRIGNVNIGGSLLDEVAVHDTVKVDDISIVLDDLDTGLAGHSGIGPLKGDLAAARGILGTQVGHGFAGVHRFEINIRAGCEKRQNGDKTKIYLFHSAKSLL